MNIIKKAFLFCLLLSSTFVIVSIKKEIISVRQYECSSQFALLEPSYDRKKIVVNSVVSSAKSRYISFISDGEKNHYVIKQKRQGGIRKQFQVILEKVSGYIAQTLDIPAHCVELLPAGMAFPGKMMTNRAASILTLVPGIPVKRIKSGPYSRIDLRQSNRPDWSKEKLGLHKGVISSMRLHPDLARMAALDTFLGNKGRHEANYFYDKVTDRFYAIDMDKVYNSNDDKDLISKIACDQVRVMLDTKKVFRHNVLEGLNLYKETLQQLVELFPPARIYELMDEFSLASGFKKAYLPEIASRVDGIKSAVRQSHRYVVELLDLLSQLIDFGKKNGKRTSEVMI